MRSFPFTASLALALSVGSLGCGGASLQDSAREPAPSFGQGTASATPTQAGPEEPVANAVPEPASPAVVDAATSNRPGQPIELAEVLVTGKVTVVAFSADWCEPCKHVEDKVRAVMAGNRGIALRKIDIGDAPDTPVAVQHAVSSVPLVRIYGPEGTLRYTLEGREAQNAAEIADHLAR